MEALKCWWIFLIDQLFEKELSEFEPFHSFFLVTWFSSFNCADIFPSPELSFSLECVKLNIFLLMAPLIFLNFPLGYFTCDNFLEENCDSSDEPTVLFKAETIWVTSILKLFKSFSLFMSSFELEETAATFSKLLGTFAEVFLCLHGLFALSEYYEPFLLSGPTQVPGVFFWTCIVTNVHMITTVLKH